MFTSQYLHEGQVYSRADLRQMFQITDATLNTGIFQPKGQDSVWLFVTEKKSPDRTPYADKLDGDTLCWEGQTSGRKDQLIIDHAKRGLELLLFYRTTKDQFPGACFRYEGRFRYESHTPGRPAQFVLRRA